MKDVKKQIFNNIGNDQKFSEGLRVLAGIIARRLDKESDIDNGNVKRKALSIAPEDK